ncbi:MAG TPA: GAF domain-containing sensor histidine kinase, partial [Gemmatimonadaceae bacterium]|nr:GAF domain-containing sensor histidine kinase [Gemmatimonadaceae bacterium]
MSEADKAERAVRVLREVARAALSAERADEALRVALERVTPLVGAAFAAVFLLDEADGLLRVSVSHNWPGRWHKWLNDMRVQPGSGPTGLAAVERRVIEVADIHSDPSLGDWREAAEELGVGALVALPLAAGTHVFGAVTFYFSGAGGFSAVERDLLRAVTDQMALTVAMTKLADRTFRAESRTVTASAEVDRQRVAAIEAARSRDEFLANVSHELRTPLTVVLATIDLLAEELGGPLTDAQREDLSHARDASERLLDLVETLLALSALRRGTLELAVTEFDARDPLRDALKAAGKPGESVKLVVEEPRTFLPPMRGDREKATRVIGSLLSNAYKFTPSGKVTASVDAAKGRVRYRIADTGIGIPLAAQPTVFEEFRQADSSATRRYGGSGLGLALARGLARLMGGEVEMVSEDGTGSIFTLELPLNGST